MELTGQLSNPPHALTRLFSRTKPQVRPSTVDCSATPPRQHQVRLSRHQQAELVDRYQAGALRRELAEAYGIGTGTVSGILKRHGATRKRGLSESEVELAVVQYKRGESLAQIAETFETTPNTVRTRLIASGVAMRSTSGCAQ